MSHVPIDDVSEQRRRRHPLKPLEWLTILHVSVYLVAATWAFGGQTEWVRTPLNAWGSLGALITLSAVLQNRRSGGKAVVSWWWAVPFLLFNAVVLVAALNPSLREIRHESEVLLQVTAGRPGFPSSAQPQLARLALWEFDVMWISCFNICLVVGRRRALRALLLVLVANALALSVFGTVQKLLRAPGLFFGSVPSPQKYFFASFVYHNHWGAFILLALGACLGLIAYYVRHHTARDFFHSPAFLGLAVLAILALTIPLSASRSATILATVILGGAFLHWIWRMVQQRRHFNESTWPPVLGAFVAVVIACAGIWHVARDTITTRVALTVEQVQHARKTRQPDSRIQLYRDTWQMAQAKPWFGWGMASYPHVFTIYNTRAPVPHFPVFYNDAHSDWLQSLAEHGVIGSTLLASIAVVPLVAWWRRRAASRLGGYLLFGCGIILVYALLEFPFGNYAVRLVWWVCFFTAVKYALLPRAGAEPNDPLPGNHVRGVS